MNLEREERLKKCERCNVDVMITCTELSENTGNPAFESRCLNLKYKFWNRMKELKVNPAPEITGEIETEEDDQEG